jgi:hypothetical protein
MYHKEYPNIQNIYHDRRTFRYIIFLELASDCPFPFPLDRTLSTNSATLSLACVTRTSGYLDHLRQHPHLLNGVNVPAYIHMC